MEWLLFYLAEFFALLWRADDRPQARTFTLGCLGLLIVLAVGFCLILWFW